MPWNHMKIELAPADALVRPVIGPGGLSRTQALTEVQSILERLAAISPQLWQVVGAWRRGAQDDTVYAGPFTWTVYEYPDGEDPRRAALAWLEDFAATMRTAGLNVQVAAFPEG